MQRADSFGKTLILGKTEDKEEKLTTKDEMVRWHHRLNGYESGWTLGVGDGQGGLAWYGSWDLKESYMTEQLNWNELKAFDHNYRTLWKRWEYQTTRLSFWEIHMQVKKQQLELDMEQQTGSK